MKLHAILASEESITAFYGQIMTDKLYIWPLSLAKPMSCTALLYVSHISLCSLDLYIKSFKFRSIFLVHVFIYLNK